MALFARHSYSSMHASVGINYSSLQFVVGFVCALWRSEPLAVDSLACEQCTLLVATGTCTEYE
eukprot:m.208035 g.208035  ORF g.208035 m.208035 type:complete len:63 (-) comp32999_c0_seq7:193-381(-)